MTLVAAKPLLGKAALRRGRIKAFPRARRDARAFANRRLRGHRFWPRGHDPWQHVLQLTKKHRLFPHKGKGQGRRVLWHCRRAAPAKKPGRECASPRVPYHGAVPKQPAMPKRAGASRLETWLRGVWGVNFRGYGFHGYGLTHYLLCDLGGGGFAGAVRVAAGIAVVARAQAFRLRPQAWRFRQTISPRGPRVTPPPPWPGGTTGLPHAG